MNSSDFEQDWTRWFGDIAPLGFVLRGVADTGWVRLHALPDSKRYAETEAEARVILGRANRLGGEMFPDGTPLWVSVMGDGDKLAGPRPAVTLTRVIEEDPDDEDWIGTFDIYRRDWAPGAFDRLLGDVAEDRLRALFFDPATGRVFAPYDGGFDLFWESGTLAQAALKRHPRWRSTHPSGL